MTFPWVKKFSWNLTALSWDNLNWSISSFWISSLPALGLELNAIGFPESPVGWLQILGILSPYNHMNQFLITRLSLHITHIHSHTLVLFLQRTLTNTCSISTSHKLDDSKEHGLSENYTYTHLNSVFHSFCYYLHIHESLCGHQFLTILGKN